jgi:DMATS type aromatic prenyltransferase
MKIKMTIPSIPETIPEHSELKGKAPLRDISGIPAIPRETIRTPSWDLTSTWLIGANDDIRAWWDCIGPQVAILANEAGYSVAAQTEILLLLHSIVLPDMGRFPPVGQNRPAVQYSWRINTDDYDHPILTLTVEAPGEHAKGSSSMTRRHLQATQNIVEQLAAHLPPVDLTWYNHFVAAFQIDHHTDHSSHHRTFLSTDKDTTRPRMPLSFEFTETGVIPKVYIYPPAQAHERKPSLAIFTDAIRPISESIPLPAFEELVAFVDNHPVGVTLNPEMLGVDCIEPAQASLYLHASTPVTNFESIIAVMTLGGRVHAMDMAIMELWELLCLVLRPKYRDRMFSWGDELPVWNAHVQGDEEQGLKYCFEILSGVEVPEVTLYIPVVRYGPADEDVAAGLERFLKKRGQAQFAYGFWRVLNMLSEGWTNSGRVMTHIACSFRGESLDVTSSMEPAILRSRDD